MISPLDGSHHHTGFLPPTPTNRNPFFPPSSTPGKEEKPGSEDWGGQMRDLEVGVGDVLPLTLFGHLEMIFSHSPAWPEFLQSPPHLDAQDPTTRQSTLS